ncbi:MAG: hypothetical protein ACKO41_06385, partial [Sphingomonadales bacterium]
MQPRRANIIFSVIFTIFSLLYLGSFVNAQEVDHKEGTHEATGHSAEPKKFNAAEVIFGHVLDGHEYHFMDIGDHPVTLPLPIILYSPSRGTWDVFMSSRFEHGHA